MLPVQVSFVDIHLFQPVGYVCPACVVSYHFIEFCVPIQVGAGFRWIGKGILLMPIHPSVFVEHLTHDAVSAVVAVFVFPFLGSFPLPAAAEESTKLITMPMRKVAGCCRRSGAVAEEAPASAAVALPL
jgi:hypothetical protein